MVPVLDAACGPGTAARLLADAGLDRAPDGGAMIPEGGAARLHAALRRHMPDRAPAIAAEAGRRTGDYILAHRIPAPAQRVLRALPPVAAAPMLARAIARHAWTFAGSGRFSRQGAWRFTIADNPLIRGERAEAPACVWHAAVFQRLYAALVAPDCRCHETQCAATGDTACTFVISRTLGAASRPAPVAQTGAP